MVIQTVIKDILQSAAERLKPVSDTPVLDARILMETACGCDRLFLIKNRDSTLDEKALIHFESLLSQRLLGKPIAYITGHKEFMGLDFLVNEDVLIPRPDTEALVEFAIKTDKKRILDIGTGSGAIAVSLAKYIPDASVYAIDISENALKTAAENAARNSVSIRFLKTDVLSESLPCGFDLIVSNPPYIKSSVIPTLAASVKNFEPITALSGGEDGLLFYREITKKAAVALESKGILAYEIGYDQAYDVTEIMREHFEDITVIKDLSGCDRVVWGMLSNA